MMLSAKPISSAAALKRSSRAVPRVAVPAPLAKRSLVVVRAEADADDAAAKLQAQAEEALKVVQEKWEQTENSEKPAAIAILVGVIVAQIAIGATIDAVDKIPIVNKGLQLIGVIVSGLFAYRYFTEPAERDNVKKSLDSFVKSVTGEK